MSRLLDMMRDQTHLHAAYQRVFETPDGQLVLRHLMKTGYVFETTFVAGDTHRTALNEGSRRMVLSIVKFVKRDHKELVKQIEGVANENM